MGPFSKKNFRFIVTGVLVLGMILMIISMMPGLTWANFDRTSGIGPADYRLKVDFDAVGFSYTIDISSGDSGGIIGVGGFGGNNTIKNEKTYPEVRGEFLDNVGLLYNSYREKSFQYELKMRSPPEESDITWDEAGNPAVYLNVSMESDLIPWWPESGKRDLDIRIDLTDIDLIDLVSPQEKETLSVQINKVRLKALVGYNKETGEYEGGEKEIASKDVTIQMKDIGDVKRVTFSIEYPEGEDAIGLFAEIEGNLTDFWGRPQLSPLPGKANPINVYPMSNGKLIMGFGIPLALPIMLISIIISIIFLLLGFIRGKFRTGLLIPAGVLSLIAPIWFIMGMNAAVDLLGERLTGAEDGLSWGPGVFVSFAGAGLVLAAIVLTILMNRLNRSPLFKKLEGNDGTPEQGLFKKVEDGNDPPSTQGTFKRIDENIPPPPIEPQA